MTPEERAILQAERIVQYGKLYLKYKEEGIRLEDISQLDRTKIFKYMLAHRMHAITSTVPENLTDEEFIANREQRVQELRGK